MNIFLIDYENVNSIGLNGIDLLTKDDRVYLFYSENANSINIDIMNIIVKGNFSFKNFKLNKSDKNALDFQLVLFLGTMIKSKKSSTNFYIISHDNGYQSAIDFAKEQFNVDIKKFDSIYNAINGINIKNNAIENIISQNSDISNVNNTIIKETNPIRDKIEAILLNNQKITSKISEQQIKHISNVLVNPEKNTQQIATECIKKIIGNSKLDLIPVILESCSIHLIFDYVKNEPLDLVTNSSEMRLYRRSLILDTLNKNTTLKEKLTQNQLNNLATLLADSNKNTKEIAPSKVVLQSVGKQNQDLIPTILSVCKDYIR